MSFPKDAKEKILHFDQQTSEFYINQDSDQCHLSGFVCLVLFIVPDVVLEKLPPSQGLLGNSSTCHAVTQTATMKDDKCPFHVARTRHTLDSPNSKSMYSCFIYRYTDLSGCHTCGVRSYFSCCCYCCCSF